MKKLLLFLIFFFLLPSFLLATSKEEKRRIEEEKRESLRESETQPPETSRITPRATKFAQVEYFQQLISKEVALQLDACKTLFILMKLESEYKDPDSQIAFLKEKEIIPQSRSDFNPLAPLRKGLAAYMFCKTLGIKGGWILRLFGMSQRYCLKELVFQGIMYPGNVNDIVSGKELIFMLTQAADYAAENLK